MTTIKVTKTVRKQLRNFEREDEVVEETVNRLLDLAEPYLVNGMGYEAGSTNINVSETTMKRIKSFREYDSESYGNILQRVFDIIKYNNL